MNRFDIFYNSIFEILKEADGDMNPGLPPPPAGGAAAAAPPGPTMPTGSPDSQQMPPVAPEDNIKTDENSKTALVSGKKLQLVKLIAVAISTRAPSTDSQDSHKKQIEIQEILTSLSKPVTDGSVEKMEKLIIRSIAKLQDISPYEIAKTIDYTTPGPEEESNRYIDITEYKDLVEIARKALIANPNEVAGVDKLNIKPSKIDGTNADKILSKIQDIYGRVL